MLRVDFAHVSKHHRVWSVGRFGSAKRVCVIHVARDSAEIVLHGVGIMKTIIYVSHVCVCGVLWKDTAWIVLKKVEQRLQGVWGRLGGHKGRQSGHVGSIPLVIESRGRLPLHPWW